MKKSRLPARFLIAMLKFTCFHLFLAILTLGISWAGNSYSQETLARTVTLQIENQDLQTALATIERNARVKFSYDLAIIPDEKVNLRARGESLAEVLEKLLVPLHISYSVSGKYIVLARRQEEEINGQINNSAVGLFQAPPINEIRGTVTDENGQGLPGVSILIKGTQRGTITDSDGRFTIDVPNGNGVLVFSYVGYQTQEIEVGSNTTLNVILKVDEKSLEEVVIVGYGVQRKATLTGAVNSVNTTDINDIPLANMSNGLAGRAPGVQVVGNSGLAGASSSVRIRGSFGDPLFVINGVIKSKADFDALNPNEVESISFLKDAASASVYGSSAGNGVVVVTTKGGVNQKPTFEYKTNFSASTPTMPLQGFTAQEEIIYINNMAISNGQPAPYGQEVLDYFKDKSYDINDLIWRTPTTQEHNLSLRGGSDAVSYYLLLGFHNEKGSYKKLDYDRFNIRSDVTTQITENLKLNINIGGNQRDYSRWYWPYDGAEDFVVSDFYRSTFNWTRLYPFYIDESGYPTNNPKDIPVKPAGGWHPPQLMLNEGGYRKTRYRSLDGIARLDLNLGRLLPGLSTSAMGSLTAYDRNMKSFVVHNKFYIFQPGTTSNQFIPGPIDYKQMGSHNLSASYEGIHENITLSNAFQLNWFLNYQRSFGRHDVSALAVYEQAKFTAKNISGEATELLSSNIDQIYNASSDRDRRWFTGSEDENARASWIGRANYTFANKYIAEFSFRYDGNYKFAPEKRWGFFPSASVAWRLNEESFLKNASWLDDLKLRFSYGTTGSDSGINAWRWSQTYQKSTGYVFGNSLQDGLVPGAVPNPLITWATVSLWNAGLDFALLKNRLTGELDFWGKKESDILGERIGSTPSTYGATLPAVNYAERSWKGFEINLEWRDRRNDFSYSVYGNLGYARDRWDKFDEPETFTNGTYKDNWRSRIGKPNNRVQGYIAKGIIRTQAELDALPSGFTQFGREPRLGTILFEDIRGANFSEGPDGKIDANDMTYLSDNGAPRINFGFGVRLEWKRISLNSHFQGVGAYDRMITTLNGGGVFQVDRPYFSIWAKDYWTPENPDAKYPRVAGVWMYEEYGGGPSSFWLRNGAYLRLKNLNIGYSVPSGILKNIGINDLRVYVNGTNLLVLTGMIEHDPEQERLDSYPLMKTFTAGLSIQF